MARAIYSIIWIGDLVNLVDYWLSNKAAVLHFILIALWLDVSKTNNYHHSHSSHKVYTIGQTSVSIYRLTTTSYDITTKNKE